MEASLGRGERASITYSQEGISVFLMFVCTALAITAHLTLLAEANAFLFSPQAANSSSLSQFQAKDGLRAAGRPWVSCSELGNYASPFMYVNEFSTDCRLPSLLSVASKTVPESEATCPWPQGCWAVRTQAQSAFVTQMKLRKQRGRAVCWWGRERGSTGGREHWDSLHQM